MIINPSFELTDVADEYMAVPTGEAAKSFNGVVALSEASFNLLKRMTSPKTKDDLLNIILSEYDVDAGTARKDLDILIDKLTEIGLIIQ